MSGTNPTDTTTTLNPGSGGDVMDESAVTQSDGVTVAKRPRVDLGFQGSGGSSTARLVGDGVELPVVDDTVHTLLVQMLNELKLIRLYMASIAGITTGESDVDD